MKVTDKRLAEAKVKEAEKELSKAKKELKEALICGPTGSFTSSVARSAKIMGYTGLHEAEDDDYEFEDDSYADTETAVEIAYPGVSEEVKKIITTWYNNEGASEDFSDDSEFTDYIGGDIGAMLDAADDPERSIVAKELVAKGYLDDDLWSSDLEESVKKPLKESVSEKPFDEVEEGDIAIGWNGEQIRILEKGTVEGLCSEYPRYACDYPEEDADNDAVLGLDLEYREKAVYYYGGGFGGISVEVEKEDRVRQISFDFIDTGFDEADLISKIKDAMETAGVEIVGGPQFGDTSWSKEEYGLKESTLHEAKIDPITKEVIQVAIEHTKGQITGDYERLGEELQETLEQLQDACMFDDEETGELNEEEIAVVERLIDGSAKDIEKLAKAVSPKDYKNLKKELKAVLKGEDFEYPEDEEDEEDEELDEAIIGQGRYGIEVKDARGIWSIASENYPHNGEPAEFRNENAARGSDLWNRLVDRYGADKVRTFRQD